MRALLVSYDSDNLNHTVFSANRGVHTDLMFVDHFNLCVWLLVSLCGAHCVPIPAPGRWRRASSRYSCGQSHFESQRVLLFMNPERQRN